jgi:serine/threonine protein kinase
MHIPVAPLELAVHEVVAKGAYGRISRAVDRDGREVAVKSVRQSDPGWTREVAALRRVDHPAVLRLEHACRWDGEVHMVTALYSRDLFEVLRAERPSEPRAVEYAREMLVAVAAVLAAGMQHLDVKLENFCVDAAGRLVLIDLGSAEVLSDGWSTPTEYSVGTDAYLAPELAYDRRFTQTTDVWGVGVALFGLLADALPYALQPGPSARMIPSYTTIERRVDQLAATMYVRMALFRMLDCDPCRRPTPAAALVLLQPPPA